MVITSALRIGITTVHKVITSDQLFSYYVTIGLLVNCYGVTILFPCNHHIVSMLTLCRNYTIAIMLL